MEEIRLEHQGRFLLKVQLSHDLGEVGVDYTLSVLSQPIDDAEGQGATISIEEETQEESSTFKESGCSVVSAHRRSTMTFIVCVVFVLGVAGRKSYKS